VSNEKWGDRFPLELHKQQRQWLRFAPRMIVAGASLARFIPNSGVYFTKKLFLADSFTF
jgi:hypothetical protein